jgi:hypothetical protein
MHSWQLTGGYLALLLAKKASYFCISNLRLLLRDHFYFFII